MHLAPAISYLQFNFRINSVVFPSNIHVTVFESMVWKKCIIQWLVGWTELSRSFADWNPARFASGFATNCFSFVERSRVDCVISYYSTSEIFADCESALSQYILLVNGSIYTNIMYYVLSILCYPRYPHMYIYICHDCSDCSI